MKRRRNSQKNSTRKTFIIDTSVLLYDKTSIHSFPENDVIIPLVVLDELDRFKDKNGIIGENARYINRYLDSLRKIGKLSEGVAIPTGEVIKVAVDAPKSFEGSGNLDLSIGDNKIIAIAHSIKTKSSSETIVVTKDINFRVKCDALGITAEDYYKDNIPESSNALTQEIREVQIDGDQMARFHKEGKIHLEEIFVESEGYFLSNEPVILKNSGGSGSGLGIAEGD